MEATIGAAVRQEDKLLILANGAYGKRMAQIADYYHINYVLVSLHETELVSIINSFSYDCFILFGYQA